MSLGHDREQHWISYPRFLVRAVAVATDGPFGFYAWMTVLTAVALVGANAWANQVVQGMITTGMTDHVSWGLYIANFTFMVGVAAGGVMMVIPAYLYHDEEMHNVVILGERHTSGDVHGLQERVVRALAGGRAPGTH